ncbi:MAG: hypothetical protein VX438_03735 [Planctomycetota bacterium]|nr:hypothetical protein [Planctomycetota bacterium]
MSEKNDSNWDDLARQFGFEPAKDEKEDPGVAEEIVKSANDEVTPVPETETPAETICEPSETEVPVVEPPVVSGESVTEMQASDSNGEIETVEFDVQDLNDDEEDRPRRRRKQRRRRRAVIEELREELEREKEEETVEPVESAEETENRVPENREDEAGSVPRREPEKRRRRRKSNIREEQPQPAESQERVSKNQRRRKRRFDEPEKTGSESSSERDRESKPERKFPTWEEAIHPVVEANIKRVSKPQRKKRPPRRSRED